MSRLKLLEDEQDWICNNPTEEEIRFNHECDILSSDDSDGKNNSSKLRKYNQLLPIGKAIHKLLHPTRCELSKSWRIVGSETHLLNKNFKSKSNLHSNTLQQNTSGLKSNTDISRRRVEPNLYYPGKDLETESESTSSEEMAKSHKRKRQSSASTEEESRSLKKIKTRPDENLSVVKKVKRKANSHNVSSSENESLEEKTSKRIKHKGRPIDESKRLEVNTHLLSSESDNEVNTSQDLSSSDLAPHEVVGENGEVSEYDKKSLENSEEEINYVEDSVTASSNSTDIRKYIHRIPKYTDELNEEISKFSLLLNENLLENHDFWILQCPSDMDCSALVNQRLGLGDSCQLSDGEKTYEAYSYRNTHTRSANLAVPSQRNHLKLCRIPVSGNIIVEELVEPHKNDRPNDVISESTSRVEFPENLRVRHPLLGINFSKQPRTATRIESSPKKKKHSKKHGESFNGLTEESQSTPTSTKKKKKNKDISFEDAPVTDPMEELQDETLTDGAVKKKKKKKHKDNDSFN